MTKTRYSIIAVGIIIMAALLFALATPTYKVKYLDYALSPELPETELFDYMGFEKGSRPIFLVSTRQVEKALLEHPYIETVTCTKVYPNTLKLDILQKPEFCAVELSDQYAVLDSGGVVMRLAEKAPELPRLEGVTVLYYCIGDDLKAEERQRFEKALDLVDLLDQAGLSAGVRIHVSKSGMAMTLPKDLKVYFGTFEKGEEQFAQFMAIYADLKTRKISAGEIEVRGDTPPVYRFKE